MKTESYIKTLAKVSHLYFVRSNESFSTTATSIVDQLEIHIPLTDLIDKKIESIRIKKEIIKLQKEEEKSLKKLSNLNYLKKAPRDIVKRERLLLEKTQRALRKLQSQYVDVRKL